MGALFTASVLFYMLVKISAIKIAEKSDKTDTTDEVFDTVYEDADSVRVVKAESYCDSEMLEKKRLESVSERMKRIGYAFSSLSSVMSEMNKRMGKVGNRTSVRTGMDTLDRTEIFAADYDAISDLLADAMVVAESDCDISREFEARIMEEIEKEFTEMDIPTVGVSVWGQRKKVVSFRCAENDFLKENKKSFDSIVERVLPEVTFKSEFLGGEKLEYCCTEKIKISFAHRIVSAAAEEEYCGDSVGALYDDDDRFFAFISDGMGSGREAAVTSGYVSLFLCKLLGASCPASSVIKMINSFLRGRNSSSEDECSATVDLMELDTLSGAATFYKSGASPTYVFRNGTLFKLRAKSAPLGILRETGARKVSFEVSEGDLIVMVSDGVTGGKEECPRLFDTVRGLSKSSSPEDVADAIVKYAKSEASCDDISVIAIRISSEAKGA
jgi:serine/threonine protein phosphatase PrpC